MANPLYQKHIISINDLSREDLELVLATAANSKPIRSRSCSKHKVIASCFFEASTRTRLSFETSCTAWAPAWSVSQTAATPRWAKKAKPWPIPSRSSAPMSMPSSCATRRRARRVWRRVLRRYSGTQRRRRREPASDADPAGSVHHSGDPGPSGKS